jgi:hypothetical protein
MHNPLHKNRRVDARTTGRRLSTMHGGLSAALLDSCMALAIQSTPEKGVGSTTLEFKDFTGAADHVGDRSDQGSGGTPLLVIHRHEPK